jgi:hypothetical protein
MVSERPRTDVIENLAKIAALGAAFLPVAGYIVRLFAFIPGPGKEAAFILAWKTSLAGLVVTGAYGLLPMSIAALLVSPIARSPRPRAGWRRWVGRLSSAAVAFLLLVFIPSFSLAVLALGGGVLAYRLFAPVIRRAGRVVYTEVWPRVVVVVAYSAVMSGVNGLLPGVTADDFHFTQQVAALTPNARYTEIGEDGQTIYLEDCGGHNLITVETSSVELRRVQQSATTIGPSLVEIIVLRKPPILGFVPSC